MFSKPVFYTNYLQIKEKNIFVYKERKEKILLFKRNIRFVVLLSN